MVAMAVAASRSQSGPAQRARCQLALPAPSLLEGALRASLPPGCSPAAARAALQRFDTVISQTQFTDVRYGRAQILYSQPQRQPVALSVAVAATAEWFGHVLTHLCSEQLVLDLGCAEEDGFTLKVGLVPPKGIHVVTISGVPISITESDLEASSSAPSAACSVSFLPGSVRPLCSSDSGVVRYGSYVAVINSGSAAPPDQLCFSGEYHAGRSARVRVRRLAIPCLPMLPSMRQAAQQEPAPRRSEPQARPSSDAPQALARQQPQQQQPHPHSRTAASGPQNSEAPAVKAPGPAAEAAASTTSLPTADGPQQATQAAAAEAPPQGPQPQEASSSKPAPATANDGFTPVVHKKADARAARRQAFDAKRAAFLALQGAGNAQTPQPRVGSSRPRPERGPRGTPWTPAPKTARP